MFQSKKKNSKELAELPLDKKGKKGGQALLKGVRKFLRYNDDLISDEKKAEIENKRAEFEKTLQEPTAKRKVLEEQANDLTETCKKSVPGYKPSAWKENIEVVFVAVVIAMGIRAYFIQQFKIPTGSMQPTLNGIIAYPTPDVNPRSEYNAPEDYEMPALPQRLWDKFWYGRSHVSWTSKDNDYLILDRSHFYEKTHFIFFPRTYLVTKNGHTYSAPGTLSRVQNLLNLNLLSGSSRMVPVKEGDVLAKGYVDTGDQLVVNKFIYHWRKPQRGEVFVFNTQNIDGIQRELPDPRQGSQHYIKRLTGLPGDELKIEPPQLLVNGEVATESGIQRVMAKEGRYTGYTRNGGKTGVQLGEHEYWALGDNSANSSDSRNWGIVPEENIVGRGAFVYYPFGHHFGPVD
ncbi:MAG: signal peptidase I [Verrucomicrobiales bacterium]|nr:signal peptidase I [Verrucomicrobiales bacterium]